MKKHRILVDCAGGDNYPLAMIAGAKMAKKLYDNIDIILIGKEHDVINNGFKHIATSDNISSNDDAMEAVKKKKDSSIVVGLKMLKEGEADAFVSAGNTGALIGGATLFAKRLKGVKRMALAPLIPTKKNKVLLLDAGANNECSADQLFQFGVMGSIYMKKVIGIEKPRISLLNVGVEDNKGTEVIRDARKLLRDSKYNYTGFVEARAIMDNVCDVVVCDGFSGNVLLKTLEGTSSMVMYYLKKAIYSNLQTKIGGALIKGKLESLISELDYRTTGGAPMLGANGAVIKAHGSSDADAIFNAIRQAKNFCDNGVNDAIEDALY